MSDVSITADLIARARKAEQRAHWYKTGEEKLFGALADALEAVTVATDDHEPIKILRDKTFVAWQDVLTVTSERVDTEPTIGGNDRDGGLTESDRESLISLIAENMPGRDGVPKIQDVWLADAILERFRLPVPVEPETPERFPESPHVEAKYWAELVRARRRIAELEAQVTKGTQ